MQSGPVHPRTMPHRIGIVVGVKKTSPRNNALRSRSARKSWAASSLAFDIEPVVELFLLEALDMTSFMPTHKFFGAILRLQLVLFRLKER